MSRLHLILPANPDRILSLPYAGPVPPPEGRKLPNTTLLVRDPGRPDLIWKLTPWEKSEAVTPELEAYGHLRATGASGIVDLVGVSGTADHLARAYTYAPHGELARFLRDARGEPVMPPVATARAILAQIAGTMAGLHARGLVHRDLKAENILVLQDGELPQVRVADFDRAVHLPQGETVKDPVGSLFHMAPELLAWQAYDHRVDIYAYGILMFEVAHGGARPFPRVATGLPGALSAEAFAAQVITEGLRPDWRADPALGVLAARCLSHDPEERPEFSEIYRLLTGAAVPARANPAASDALPEHLGMAATIGRQRNGMEDALAVLETGSTTILAVFDGFRGGRSSGFAAQGLALILADLIGGSLDTSEALTRSLAHVQARLRRLDPVVTSGSTATVAVMQDGMLHLAWLGDSPAWLIGANGATPLIRPHHPADPLEAARVAAAGGSTRRETRMMDSGERVPWGPLRVYGADGHGGIALSRALGLPSLGAALSVTPEIAARPTGDQSRFLILASDGVSEVLPEVDITAICEGAASPGAAADALMAEVLRRGAPDNAGLIVLDLRG